MGIRGCEECMPERSGFRKLFVNFWIMHIVGEMINEEPSSTSPLGMLKGGDNGDNRFIFI